MGVLLKEQEVALMTGMSVHWLRRKRWEGGGIPFIKLSTHGAVRYQPEIVAEYIESRVRRSTSDCG
jgi:hypothetical protein